MAYEASSEWICARYQRHRNSFYHRIFGRLCVNQPGHPRECKVNLESLAVETGQCRS